MGFDAYQYMVTLAMFGVMDMMKCLTSFTHPSTKFDEKPRNITVKLNVNSAELL